MNFFNIDGIVVFVTCETISFVLLLVIKNNEEKIANVAITPADISFNLVEIFIMVT